MAKIKATFKEYRFVILSFFLAGLLFVMLLAKTGIFPFGPATLLMSDMSSQYSDFLAEYQRMLHGEGSPLYSFHAGIGLNFLGIIVYYLSSPLNLLLALFPENNLLDGITLITTLKIALSALTFSFFLKKHNRSAANSLLLTAFGVLYAFLGYSISNLFNIIWLDGVILLPLIFYAIDVLIDEDRWLPAVILYALLFLSNFYIGYMVGLFSALYFLASLFSIENKRGRFRLNKIVRFALSVILAAGLNAVLLLPMSILLKDNMGLFGQTAPAFESKFPLFDLFIKAFPGTFDGIKDSLPHVYCGLLTLLCLPVYFANRLIPIRKKVSSFLILLLMGVSFTLAPLDFAWHAFDHPSWFPYRYAFLFSFFCLLLAYQGLVNLEGASRKWIGFSAGLAVVYLMLVQKIDPEKINTESLYLSLAFILLFSPVLFFFDLKSRRASLVILLLCMAEVFYNSDEILQEFRPQYVSRVDYVAFRERNQPKIKSVLPADGAFYRVEKEEIRTYNDPMGLGYPGMANFSSIASLPQSMFLKKMGFDCYATWCTYSGSTVFSDALLGIRYIVSDSPLNHYRLVSDGIFENPYALPVAFYSAQDFSAYPVISSKDDPIGLQNAILNSITGLEHAWFTEAGLNPAGFTNLEAGESDETGIIYTRTDPAQSAEIRYQFTIPDDQPYVLFIPNVSLNYNVWLNDEQIFDQNQNYTPFLVNLDAYQKGDTLTLRIDLGKDQQYRDEARLFSFDLETFSKSASEIQLAAPSVHFDGKTHFEITVSESSQDRWLQTSIPYDDGWTALADGIPIPTIAVMNSLIGLQVPAGTKNITLSFLPPGIQTGAILSISSLLLLVLLIAVSARRKAKTPDSER